MKFRFSTFVAAPCLSSLIHPRASAQMPMIDNDLGHSGAGTFDTITVQP